MFRIALCLAAVVAATGLLPEPSAWAAPPTASAGCGRPAPEAPPDSVRVGGRSRGVIAAVPEDYRPDRPHRLVIAFHGRTNTNAEVRRYFDLERHATVPTLFVYPSGVPTGDGRFTWWPPGDKSDPYALFDAVVEAFASRYCIALDRIDVVGHSLGATFANDLGCVRGDAIHAIGTLGGGITVTGCRGSVAAIVLHNPGDQQVPFPQGIAVRDTFLKQDGLRQDGIAGAAAVTGPQGFNCRRYGPPDAGTPVLWCPHGFDITRRGTYYPHQWPRETGALIMAFFDSLP